MAEGGNDPSEFPKRGEWYNFKLGDSWNNKKKKLHTIRYDFKPASLDLNNAILQCGSDGSATISVPDPESGQATPMFVGNTVQPKKDYVLLVNNETGEITLEKIETSMRVKRTRFQKTERTAGPAAVALVAANSTAAASVADRTEKRQTNMPPSKAVGPPKRQRRPTAPEVNSTTSNPGSVRGTDQDNRSLSQSMKEEGATGVSSDLAADLQLSSSDEDDSSSGSGDSSSSSGDSGEEVGAGPSRVEGAGAYKASPDGFAKDGSKLSSSESEMMEVTFDQDLSGGPSASGWKQQPTNQGRSSGASFYSNSSGNNLPYFKAVTSNLSDSDSD